MFHKTIISATIIVICLALNPLFARVWYVAKQDTANADGTISHPYPQISQAANQMTAGDICYIRTGTYYETVRPANSGTSAAPIVFAGYQNENAVVHGGDVVTGWTVYSGNIWKTTVSPSVKEVFVNRMYMLWARHPNMPWDSLLGYDLLRPQEGTANPPANVDWTNVTLIKDGGYGWVTQILKQNTSGDGRVLMGVLGLLDAPGEWCQVSNVLYLMAPGRKDPNTAQVETKTRDYAFDLSSRNYITVKNVTVFGASILMEAATYCIIDSCKVYYPGSIFYVSGDLGGFVRNNSITVNSLGKGLVVGGSHNTVRNTEVAHSWGDCISMYGTDNTITNCRIHDADWSGTDCACINVSGQRQTISHNTLYDAGRSMLVHRNTFEAMIEYNDMFTFGMLTDDLGGTYTFGAGGQQTQIAYNWVHGSYPRTTGASGIYLDNGSNNYIIHHNVVWDILRGQSSSPMGGNAPSSNELWANNTLWGNLIPRSLTFTGNWTSTRWVNILDEQQLSRNAVISYENIYEGADHGMTNPDFSDFTLKAASPCVDAGKAVAPYTDGYTGAAPDIGAYEYGKTAWVPGATSATKFWLGSLIPGQITRRVATASATANSRVAQMALDGRMDTRWYSNAPQHAGDAFLVNLQKNYAFNRIVMDNSLSPDEYPRSFIVEVSGTNFITAASGAGSSGLTSIVFPTQTARYVRITLTADAPVGWSIFEFKLAYDTSMVVGVIHRTEMPAHATLSHISVYSLSGRSVAQADARELTGKMSVFLRPGMYLAKAYCSNGFVLTKVLMVKEAAECGHALRTWQKSVISDR